MPTTHPAPPLGTVITLSNDEYFTFIDSRGQAALVTVVTVENPPSLAATPEGPRFTFQGQAPNYDDPDGQVTLWQDTESHGLYEVQDLIPANQPALQDAIYDAAHQLIHEEAARPGGTPVYNSLSANHRAVIDRAIEISANARQALANRPLPADVIDLAAYRTRTAGGRK